MSHIGLSWYLWLKEVISVFTEAWSSVMNWMGVALGFVGLAFFFLAICCVTKGKPGENAWREINLSTMSKRSLTATAFIWFGCVCLNFTQFDATDSLRSLLVLPSWALMPLIVLWALYLLVRRGQKKEA